MTAQDTLTIEMTEEKMKTLVRNALMVAGQEMGETGDHWPVIKNTITDVMRDWEELETERAVQAEMKTHLYRELAEIEKIVATASLGQRSAAAPYMKEIREVLDAHFEAPKETAITLTGDEFIDYGEGGKPLHIRRAEEILKALEE